MTMIGDTMNSEDARRELAALRISVLEYFAAREARYSRPRHWAELEKVAQAEAALKKAVGLP